jgi:hypothetical protein
MTQSLQAAAPPIASRAPRDRLRCDVSRPASRGFEGRSSDVQGAALLTDMLAARPAPAAYAYNPARP